MQNQLAGTEGFLVRAGISRNASSLHRKPGLWSPVSVLPSKPLSLPCSHLSQDRAHRGHQTTEFCKDLSLQIRFETRFLQRIFLHDGVLQASGRRKPLAFWWMMPTVKLGSH